MSQDESNSEEAAAVIAPATSTSVGSVAMLGVDVTGLSCVFSFQQFLHGNWAVAALIAICIGYLVTLLVMQWQWLRRRDSAEGEARRFAAILGNALEGIARIDAGGIYREVNQAYAETLGFTPEELIGTSCRDAMHPEDRSLFDEFLQHARQRGKAQVEIRRIHRNGHALNLMLTLLPFEERGHPSGAFYCFQKNMTPERRALRALREATTLRQAIFDSANFAIVAITPDGDIRTINAGVGRMLGYSQPDLIGQPFLETLFLKEEVQANRDRVSLLTGAENTNDFGSFSMQAREGAVDEREWTYRRKDGTLIPVRVSLTPLRSPSGEVLGFLSIAQDLSSEWRYRDESRKLAALAQASKECIVTFALDGTMLFLNEAGRKLIGYGRSSVRTASCSSGLEYLAPASRITLLNEVLPALQARESWQGEALLLHCLTGEQIDAEASVFGVREPGSGKLLCYGAVMRDIRERKRQQAVMQTQALILDQVHDAVTTVNVDGRFTSWNGGAERIFGYTSQEMMGRQLSFLLPSGRETWTPEGLFHRVQHDGEFLSEAEVVRKDGRIIFVHNSYSLQRSPSGEVVGLITASQDITERRQAEAALRKLVTELTHAKAAAEAASRVKSEFLAMMSHEIRTPLNGIIGMSQVLGDLHLNQEQGEAAETIQSSGEILLSLINDILDFSKVEAGRLELETAPFDLPALIRETISLAQPLAANKGILLESRIDLPNTGQLLGDRHRLRQILLNLTGNAVKFSDRGTVSIAVTKIEDNSGQGLFRFEVSDQGVGLSPQQASRLFQPFAQADASTTRRFGGTGLGLVICKRLAELMGGQIGVESQLGQGSRFWFTIRAAVSQPDDLTQSDPHAAAPELWHLQAHVLLAEDNTVNQRVASKLLQALGCTVDIASNGQQAVEAMRRSSYDAVLMDLLMPEMDGLEATQLIRAEENGSRHTPIIALTANAFSDDRERCLANGMDDFISKPLRKSDLAETLSRWVTGGKTDPTHEPEAAVPASEPTLADPQQPVPPG